MKVNTGKGQYDDYLTTAERAKVTAELRRRVGRKKPAKRRKVK